ncbi:HAD-IIIC family phosphatase [Dongia sedimenti]|uniref:HAD-IIIC family phosphatase n=1 Tax=Dongia sedimenti TaxID=3064282 RepID=A0ABU0YR79_9PROT|nr:HAD-IIIC family phosphatase [Rhodospirillaceae bacterium R-7]
MADDLYARLAWLPPKPDDFSASCRALLAEETASAADFGRRVQALAQYALDENALNRLAKVIALARGAGKSLAPLTPFRLGVLSNTTSHFLVPALVATAVRHGIDLVCEEADFDQVIQEALNPDSMINRGKFDAVLVAIDHHGLPLRPAPGDAEAAARSVDEAMKQLATVREGIRANSNALCIVQTLARPPETLFGSFDLGLAGTLRNLIDGFNRALAEDVAGSKDILLDVAQMAETVGLANWHDPTLWNIGKLPFASQYIALYVDHVCRLIASLRGKSRRCLVLDLDNTLWGGVIGDDGLEGILIGQGDATGEAHLEVQRVALSLRDRGIVLAVSSKNNDDVARKPFKEHPEMLLKEDHLAVFQANWSDKASNITAIAEELALGLESFVFLDDNPAERNIVRQTLPAVAVPELPADPAYYARVLLASGYFEAITLSDEDRKRAAMYQDNARRVALQKNVADIGSYLLSLDMVMTVQPFDEVGRARIAQLIAKSNQFNLTTRRYTEVEVAEAERDPDCMTLQIRLADTFGDNGMICVIICRRSDRAWHIDTWLMSCRVLGRRVEEATLQEILFQARQHEIDTLIGTYRPTERNNLVEKHYEKLGFTLLERKDDGTTVWQLSVAETPEVELPMQVRRLGFAEKAPLPLAAEA